MVPVNITHYDLFAGIGGFSLAIDEVFYDANIKHIFCEWEQFPTAVLKQHWPNGEYWGDIADLATHTGHEQLERGKQTQTEGYHCVSSGERSNQAQDWTILTGGFPCQPFSHAGRRKGTADDRYQWPNMFAVIQNVKPEWVIAENVRGLVTWNEGVVLEQVCADLESEGYEVQPFIIPAVAVNAPHRRDRVWIIGHRNTGNAEHARLNGTEDREGADKRSDSNTAGPDEPQQPARPDSLRPADAHTRSYPDWNRNWQEVAFATCDDSVDDGLPRLVDGVPYSRAKWRKDSLKAYGNGIVPQVAMEIMWSIRRAYAIQ